jgi:hypothetical protein
MAAEMTVPDGGENLGNCISGFIPSNFFFTAVLSCYCSEQKVFT